jgi:hypothetical protein
VRNYHSSHLRCPPALHPAPYFICQDPPGACPTISTLWGKRLTYLCVYVGVVCVCVCVCCLCMCVCMCMYVCVVCVSVLYDL